MPIKDKSKHGYRYITITNSRGTTYRRRLPKGSLPHKREAPSPAASIDRQLSTPNESANKDALHDAIVYLKQGQKYVSEIMSKGYDPDRAHLCLMLALEELLTIHRENDRQEFLAKRKKG